MYIYTGVGLVALSAAADEDGRGGWLCWGRRQRCVRCTEYISHYIYMYLQYLTNKNKKNRVYHVLKNRKMGMTQTLPVIGVDFYFLWEYPTITEACKKNKKQF
jgi:hypothetical protein